MDPLDTDTCTVTSPTECGRYEDCPFSRSETACSAWRTRIESEAVDRIADRDHQRELDQIDDEDGAGRCHW